MFSGIMEIFALIARLVSTLARIAGPGGVRAVIQEAYVQGVSTRSVDKLVRNMGMSGISKSQVSLLCVEIDERVSPVMAPYPICVGSLPSNSSGVSS
jgi:hypothetical protein